MNHHFHYLQKLLAQGGPNPEDYGDLDAWLIELSENIALPACLPASLLKTCYPSLVKPLLPKPCRALFIASLMVMPVIMK